MSEYQIKIFPKQNLKCLPLKQISGHRKQQKNASDTQGKKINRNITQNVKDNKLVHISKWPLYYKYLKGAKAKCEPNEKGTGRYKKIPMELLEMKTAHVRDGTDSRLDATKGNIINILYFVLTN